MSHHVVSPKMRPPTRVLPHPHRGRRGHRHRFETYKSLGAGPTPQLCFYFEICFYLCMRQTPVSAGVLVECVGVGGGSGGGCSGGGVVVCWASQRWGEHEGENFDRTRAAICSTITIQPCNIFGCVLVISSHKHIIIIPSW